MGTCILGTTVYNPDKIIEALRLPPLVMPVLTVTIGWPDEAPGQTDRLPVEAVLHAGHYHDYAVEDIDRILRCKGGPFPRAVISWISTARTISPKFSPASVSHGRNAWRCPPRCGKSCGTRVSMNRQTVSSASPQKCKSFGV